MLCANRWLGGRGGGRRSRVVWWQATEMLWATPGQDRSERDARRIKSITDGGGGLRTGARQTGCAKEEGEGYARCAPVCRVHSKPIMGALDSVPPLSTNLRLFSYRSIYGPIKSPEACMQLDYGHRCPQAKRSAAEP